MKFFSVPILFFCFTGFTAEISLEQAKAKSAKDGKLILIDFYTDWCGPCKKFTKESKGEAEIKKALAQVHLVKLDAENEGADLAKEFSIKGYPTFVLADKEMRTIYRWWGYEKKSFIKKLDTALADAVTIEERLARFEKNKNLGDAKILAGFYETQNKFDEALAMYREADALNGDPKKTYITKVFDIKMGLHHAEKLRDFQGLDVLGREILGMENLDALQLLDVVNSLVYVAKKEKREDALTFYLDKGIAIAEKNNNSDQVRKSLASFKADQALYIAKDESAAIAHIKSSYAKGWEKDPKALNRHAWWCLQNEINLNEAKSMAKKAVELSEPGTEKANILDTWAEIESTMGNPAAAVELMERAVKEDPDSENHKKQLKRFHKEVQEKNLNSKS